MSGADKEARKGSRKLRTPGVPAGVCTCRGRHWNANCNVHGADVAAPESTDPEKSEKWQDGDAGQAFSEWRDKWYDAAEVDLSTVEDAPDGIEVDQPDEIESLDESWADAVVEALPIDVDGECATWTPHVTQSAADKTEIEALAKANATSAKGHFHAHADDETTCCECGGPHRCLHHPEPEPKESNR